MKQDKRPNGVEETKSRPPHQPAENDRQSQDPGPASEMHSGQGANSAMERMKRLDRQRARSRGAVERPQA